MIFEGTNISKKLVFNKQFWSAISSLKIKMYHSYADSKSRELILAQSKPVGVTPGVVVVVFKC